MSNELPLNELPLEDVRRIVIPQLLVARPTKRLSYETIGQWALEPGTFVRRDLTLRYEVFVDAETCTDHRNARAYVARIAADRIVSYLQQIPEQERWLAFLRITMAIDNSSLEIASRVREKMSISRP